MMPTIIRNKIRRHGVSGGARHRPWGSLVLLGVITAACLLAGLLAPYPSDLMDSTAISQPPGGSHLLGTDHMGRDLFSLLLYGGRASLYIGLLSGSLSTVIAVV